MDEVQKAIIQENLEWDLRDKWEEVANQVSDQEQGLDFLHNKVNHQEVGDSVVNSKVLGQWLQEVSRELGLRCNNSKVRVLAGVDQLVHSKE